ncbi:TetR/AcrR family transcriptional regulator [Georgenia sp. TF02-10]|uniref:TetR/AcrR family transcriptional regulator n=1 Tax=Georgenia sp. TF02-10 TaxID=2917725 RepID=UPI002111D0A4|nr:TetR/AcrR family transcriptional regulator [Georgenia sp. TF02-10]
MPLRASRVNRGPAAAAENRRAILAAARRLFAARGYRVPLQAIAKEAGVGQGVLYRHFPRRLDLALEVFEIHFAELEEIAADPAPDAFLRLWSRLLALVVEESTFVEMFVEARQSTRDYDGVGRLRALIESTLPRARQAGLLPRALTTEDVLLGVRMAYGVAATAVDGEDVAALVRRVLPVDGGSPR